jgi:peptide/nickel transport system permease protein
VELTTGVWRPKKRPYLIGVLRRMWNEKPLGTAGGIITVLFFLVGIFAPLIAPHGLNDSFPGEYLKPPSAQFWLGTDNLGRDMLSRMIYGARISMMVGLFGMAISTAISTAIGMLCGFFGGKFDLIVQRVVDAWMCFPMLIILITIMSILGGGLSQIVVVLGIVWGVGGSRIVRSAVISIKSNVYVEAARSIGCSTPKMLFQHILPNVTAPIIILFTTGMPALILTEASLSFLGYGIPPPFPSWGGMLSTQGRRFMVLAPWLAIWPGLALSLVVYGINMFGDGIRDVLDPRLKGGVGRYAGSARKRVMKQT